MRHGQPKKRTESDGGSRKKLTAGCRDAEGWKAVPFLNGIRDTIFLDKTRTRLCQERRKDGRSERDVGRNRKASMA
jgi:hypothetical protein